MNVLDRAQPLALLMLRLVLGAIMVAHGYTKIFGGMHQHVQFVIKLGLPGWLAYPSALAEFGGGLLVLFGLFTRVASLFVLINMLVAIFKVHLKNGFNGQGNYQFPLACAAIAFALIFFGAGPIGLDWLFGKRGR